MRDYKPHWCRVCRFITDWLFKDGEPERCARCRSTGDANK
jgi:hypothetical protein